MKVGRLREVLRAYHYTSGEHWSELKELERLARIGKATEKAYSKSAFLVFEDTLKSNIEGKSITDIEELLEWAEKED